MYVHSVSHTQKEGVVYHTHQVFVGCGIRKFRLKWVFEGVVGGCHVLVTDSRQNVPEDGPAACTDTQNQLPVEGQSRDSRRPCLPTPISVRQFTNTAAKIDFEGVRCKLTTSFFWVWEA